MWLVGANLRALHLDCCVPSLAETTTLVGIGELGSYLYDRTHYPQRFGTQGTCISREEWRPFEIDDLAGLAERRQKAGMPAIADYAAMFKEICARSYDPAALMPKSRQTILVPPILIGASKQPAVGRL